MNKISVIIGAVLLGVSIVLAFVSNKEQVTLENNKKLIQNYIKEANEALNNGDTKKATKLAKLAIAVDPKSKDGYKLLDKIAQTKYKPQTNNDNSIDDMMGLPGDTSPAPINNAPAPEEAEDDDMGC